MLMIVQEKNYNHFSFSPIKQFFLDTQVNFFQKEKLSFKEKEKNFLFLLVNNKSRRKKPTIV